MEQFRSNLWKYRSEDSFIDLEIEIGKNIYRCHRIVVASQPGYFRSLYSYHFFESELDHINIRVKDDLCVFPYILEYMYLGTVDVPIDFLVPTIYLAKYFDLEPLIQLLEKKFNQINDPKSMLLFFSQFQNFSTILTLPLQFNNYIAQHFSEFASDEHMQRVSYDQILSIIQNPSFRIQNEIDYANWLCHYAEKNKLTDDQIKTLGDTVLWDMISDTEWSTILWNPFLSSMAQTQKQRSYIMKVRDKVAFDKSIIALSTLQIPRIRTILSRYSPPPVRFFDFKDDIFFSPESIEANVQWPSLTRRVTGPNEILFTFNPKRPGSIFRINIKYTANSTFQMFTFVLHDIFDFTTVFNSVHSKQSNEIEETTLTSTLISKFYIRFVGEKNLNVDIISISIEGFVCN